MNGRNKILVPLVTLLGMVLSCQGLLMAQSRKENPALDAKVKKFLEAQAYQWRDMNIPDVDGKTLFDLIVKNNYKSALEIGTSTGHSGIWMAWALSRTGGKLITLEIDQSRHQQAIANFKEAGLSEYIDARLADAHQLVKELPGPFDFVFSDADKEWYKNYFLAISPKLKVGGCFTAHNIRDSRGGRGFGGGGRGAQEYLDYVQSLTNYETTVESSGGGISISYKNQKNEP